MIEINLGRTELRLDFSFFAAAAFFLLYGRGRLGAAAFAFCALHELSHLLVMSLCGVDVQAVTFCGAGIGISAHGLEQARPAAQAAVLAAGSLSNIVLSAILFVLGFREPAALCLITGALNLLPAGELDGARLLRLAALRVAPPERVDTICRAASALTVGVCLAAIVMFSGRIGLAAAAGAVYFLLMNVLKP